jgi:hypothetical protein
MKKKTLAMILALALCLVPVAPAFALDGTGVSGYSVPGIEDVWSIPGAAVADGVEIYWGPVYYADAPATATLTEEYGLGGITVTKAEFDANGEWLYDEDATKIEPTSGKLESYTHTYLDSPDTFWTYSVGSVLTLEKGTYVFYGTGPADEGFFLFVGVNPSAAPVAPAPSAPASPAPAGSIAAKPTASTVLIDDMDRPFDAYNINATTTSSSVTSRLSWA